MSQVKVEHYPELRRDEYSKGITNVDNDAYTNYMQGALARRQRNQTLEQNTKEINNLKQDVSEVKDMLRQLLNKQNGN
jgi:N-acetylglutamate synthase/N-acetylornithine aminotransferase